MSESIKTKLYESCCENLRRWDSRGWNCDSAASRSRILVELHALDRVEVLPQFAVLADAVAVAERQGIPFHLWGRPVSSMVLFAIGVNTINAHEYGLLYESWHTETDVNPFEVPGGISTSFRGRDVLNNVFCEEGASGLESWIIVCPPSEAEEILSNNYGIARLEEAQRKIRDLLSSHGRPLPRELVEQIVLSRRDLRASELIQADFHLGDLAVLYALTRPQASDSGLLDCFVDARLDRRKQAAGTDAWHEYFAATHGIPVFLEDVAELIHRELGVSVSRSCELLRSIATSPNLDQCVVESQITDLLSTSEAEDTEQDRLATFISDHIGTLFSKSAAFSIAQSKVRSVVLKEQFPVEWQPALDEVHARPLPTIRDEENSPRID